MSNRSVRVLLIEDHSADVALTRKAFSRIATPHVIEVAIDGVEAMKYLRRQGRYSSSEVPDIILLDLNMPRMGGREVLQEIEKDGTHKHIPVVILTTSAAPHDVRDAYDLCANSYLTKPVSFEDFVRLVKAIEAYWFQTALLPK